MDWVYAPAFVNPVLTAETPLSSLATSPCAAAMAAAASHSAALAAVCLPLPFLSQLPETAAPGTGTGPQYWPA